MFQNYEIRTFSKVIVTVRLVVVCSYIQWPPYHTGAPFRYTITDCVPLAAVVFISHAISLKYSVCNDPKFDMTLTVTFTVIIQKWTPFKNMFHAKIGSSKNVRQIPANIN